jgi:hypothetical protein
LTNSCCVPQVQTTNDGVLNKVAFDVIEGYCIFDGSVNNKNAKFCIDNGSGTTMIDSTFFFSEILDTDTFTFRGLKRQINLYTYNGELQINIGGVIYRINEFKVINFNNIDAKGIYLILGYDVLKDRVLKIDFPDKTIEIISDVTSLDSSGYHKIPLTQSTKYFHRRFFEADVFTSNSNNHKKGKFILDLGCGGDSLDAIFRQKFFNSLQKDIKQKDKGFATSIDNQSQTQFLTVWQIDSIVFSGICVSNVYAGTVSIMLTNGQEDPFVMDPDIDAGLIGWRFFQHYCIAIDFKNNLLLIKAK